MRGNEKRPVNMERPSTAPRFGGALERVVVATDLSLGARRAVRRASLLPLAGGARIELLHVLPEATTPRPPKGAMQEVKKALANEARYLQTQLQQHGQKNVSIEMFAVSGRPFAEILRHSHARHAQLIVIGRHGGAGFRSLLIGSTAERVVRGRTAPVLVVTADARRPYRRPLIAVDPASRTGPLSECAMRVLPADLAQLEVLAAYEVAYEGYMRADGMSSASIRSIRREQATACRKAVAEQVSHRVPKTTRLRLLVKRGDAREVIRRVSMEHASDLVVLGSHSRRGLARFLLGSVAVDILRSLTVDVLIIPRETRAAR